MTSEKQIEIKSRYLGWLRERIHAHTGEYSHYNYVINKLYSTPAFAILKGDEDRIKNAIWEREAFLDAYPIYTIEELNNAIGVCSLLELGYSLAKLTNSQIIREELYWDATYETFWELMENIGFLEYTDRYINTHKTSDILIDIAIDVLNERRYQPDGTGNWFMLRSPRDGIDMRNIDLLHQSWAYVNEGQGVRWGYKEQEEI